MDWTDCPWSGRKGDPPPLPKSRKELDKALAEVMEEYCKTDKLSMAKFAGRFNVSCEGMYLDHLRFNNWRKSFVRSDLCVRRLIVNDPANYARLLHEAATDTLAGRIWSSHTYSFDGCQFISYGRRVVEFLPFTEQLAAVMVMCEKCKEVGWNE